MNRLLVKKQIASLIILFWCGISTCGQVISNDTLFIYNNMLEKDNNLTLDEQKAIIEKAIFYSEGTDHIYEMLYFKEKEISYYYSTANYAYLPDLSNELLEEVDKHIKQYQGDKKWIYLHVDALYDVGISFVLQGNYTKGAEVFHKISTIYPDDLYASAKMNNGLGIISANKNAFEKALSYFSKCLELYISLNEQNGIFKTYSNIGLLYLSQNKHQESLSNFLKAHQVVVETGTTGEKQINANYYLAMAYSGLEDYDTANVFFKEAIKMSQERQYKRLLCFSQYNYAKSLFSQKNYLAAEEEALKALKYFQESDLGQMATDALALLANIYEHKKDYVTALNYQKQYAEMLNNFLKTEKEENMKKLESSIEDYKLQNKIIDFELTKTKLSYRNLWIGVLMLVSVILLFVLIILYRKFFIQRKRNDLVMLHMKEIKQRNTERLQSIEERMNEEIDIKNKELLSNSLLFLRLSGIASSIIEKISILKKNISKPKVKILVYEIESLVSELSLDKDWGEFEFYFQQIDSDFFNKLSEQFPSLSLTEKRMCVFFRLDLKNKEIATLMQKTDQSVSMAKIRVKRKMNVDSNEELLSLLNSL